MKAETKEQRGENNFLYGLIIVTVLAGGGLYFLSRHVEKMRARVDQSVQELQKMRGYIREIQEMDRKHPNIQQIDRNNPPRDVVTYLQEKAERSGIPKGLFNVNPQPPDKREGWAEHRFDGLLNSGQNQMATRSNVLDFLLGVEQERPYLKTKDLDLNFKGTSVDRSRIRIVFYIPAQGN